MTTKTFYQIEVINANGEPDVPVSLCDWEVFETKEDAQEYADEFVDEEYTIVEYNESDIEEYSIIRMPKDRKGNRIHINDKVKWYDPAIHDYDEDERESAIDRIWEVYNIIVTGCDDDNMVCISSGGSEAEVLAVELEVVNG